MACYYCDTERTCERCLGQSEAKCPGCGIERQFAGGFWWCFTCPVPSDEPLVTQTPQGPAIPKDKRYEQADRENAQRWDRWPTLRYAAMIVPPPQASVPINLQPSESALPGGQVQGKVPETLQTETDNE